MNRNRLPSVCLVWVLLLVPLFLAGCAPSVSFPSEADLAPWLIGGLIITFLAGLWVRRKRR